MDAATLRRFEAEFAPRIAREITRHFDSDVRAEVVPGDGHERPARVKLSGVVSEPLRRHPYSLNIQLTWDDEEIEALMRPEGPKRFRHYLAALPRKLRGWQEARAIDFHSRTQAEESVLIGGLDFEG